MSELGTGDKDTVVCVWKALRAEALARVGDSKVLC